MAKGKRVDLGRELRKLYTTDFEKNLTVAMVVDADKSKRQIAIHNVSKSEV